jgi:hypothetical protein
MSIRQFLISTIALAILPAAVLRASDSVEYVGGTVKAIPMNSVGFLNVYEPKVLKFNYGQSEYKLPYDQITGTEITKGETKHVLKKLPVPSLFGRKKETLTISYKDPAGATGTLTFELAAKQASIVQNTIAEQKAIAQATANQSDEWWGDKYWKTNSNRSAWEAKTATADKAAPPAPAATKN